MDLDQRRRWDRLACDLAELLKRLESGDFPIREDWTLVLRIGTIAEEIGRPRPVRMSVERDEDNIPTWLVLRSSTPTGPSSVYEENHAPEARARLVLPFTAFPDTSEFEKTPLDDDWRNPWRQGLRDVATFLAGTWLPTIELARPIELSGRARRAVELLAKRPEGMLGKDLASDLPCEEKNLGRDLSDVIRKGLVDNPRDGYGYRLTVLGRAWADEHLSRPAPVDGSLKDRDGSARAPRGKAEGTPKAR